MATPPTSLASDVRFVGAAMADLVKFPGPKPDAEAYARAETERKNNLFKWADEVLERLGLTMLVAQAQSLDALKQITLDDNNIKVRAAWAINDALHPATGSRAEHFSGLTKDNLRGVLRSRLNEKKKIRQAELLGGYTGTAGNKGSSYSWTNDLKFDAKGNIRPNLTNLTLFLREHPTWKGVFAYDEFAAHVAVRKRPYWGDEPPDAPLIGERESLVRIWFEREDIAANQTNCGRAIQTAARANRFHPLRDHFDALAPRWDGVKRIYKLLPTYFHTEDNEFARAVGARWLISGVARIYRPGEKVDHVLVLEGPQGRRSSQALRALAMRDEWFTDNISRLGSKDVKLEMLGVFIVEFGELEPLLRATTGGAKSFITRQFELYVPPYGKHKVHQPRGCIFAGTINPPPNGYLKDVTGSRRIWPVFCPSIDLEALKRDVEQIWAEAIVRYLAHDPWWLETPELEALAVAEQAKRYEIDHWQESVEKWVGKRKNVGVDEVLEHALGIAPKAQNRSAQMRVAKILGRLGFSKYRPGKPHAEAKRPSNRYWRE